MTRFRFNLLGVTLLIAALVFILTPILAIAQGIPIPADAPVWLTPDVLMGMIACITPLIVWVVDAIPWLKIPTWTYPMLAGVLGWVLNILSSFVGTGTKWYYAIALGLVGVGIREVISQLKKRITGDGVKALSAPQE